MTYYYLRTGQLLFRGDQAQVMYAHLELEPDLSHLPPAEGAVLARALSKEPGKRWQNCKVFVSELIAAANPVVSPGAVDSAPDRLNKLSEEFWTDPQNEVDYHIRAAVWIARKEYDKAIADCDESIRLDPNYAVAYHCRGLVWHHKMEFDKAIADYNEAIRLNPVFPPAYIGRGDSWLGKKQYAQMIADYCQAIRIDPDYGSTLAWLLATCSDDKVRDGNRAIRLAIAAYRRTYWKDGWELSTLAAAYAEAGQFDEAERYQRRALDDPEYHSYWNEFRRRLELYGQKKPYRQDN